MGIKSIIHFLWISNIISINSLTKLDFAQDKGIFIKKIVSFKNNTYLFNRMPTPIFIPPFPAFPNMVTPHIDERFGVSIKDHVLEKKFSSYASK